MTLRERGVFEFIKPAHVLLALVLSTCFGTANLFSSAWCCGA